MKWSTNKNCILPETTDIPAPKICYGCNKTIISNHIVRVRIPGSAKPMTSTLQIRIVHTPSFKAPCSKTLCCCCHHMSKKERIQTNTGLSYPTAENTDCNTKNANYLLECTCQKKYVGQTSRPLRCRMSGHRAYTLKVKNMPLYTHLRERKHNFNHLSLTILDVTQPDHLHNASFTGYRL